MHGAGDGVVVVVVVAVVNGSRALRCGGEWWGGRGWCWLGATLALESLRARGLGGGP